MEYEAIEYNGQPARKYPDGSIRNERGHWLTAHPAGHTITQEDASTLARSYHDSVRHRVRERLTAEMRSFRPSINTDADTYAEIVTKKAVDLFNSDKPLFDDVKQLGEIGDWIPSKQQQAETQRSDVLEGAVAGLLTALARAIEPRGEVVDGETVEG